jgi:hypothetical protein
VPPGFRTRYASARTAGMDVQFRIPNEIVYRSYVFDGISVIDSAFASRKDICGAILISRLDQQSDKRDEHTYCCDT